MQFLKYVNQIYATSGGYSVRCRLFSVLFEAHNRLIEPFLPTGSCVAVSTLAAEFFLEAAGETGEKFGITNGCWMSEVKVRKAIVIVFVVVVVCVCLIV